MKVAVICNTDTLAVPSINYLVQKGALAGIAVLERNRKYLEGALRSAGIDSGSVAWFEKPNWEEQTGSWLTRLKPDMVWVFGFPWKLTPGLLAIPRLGFYNFHFGLFPKYKGADPVFWQIRNKEEKGGFMVHLVNEETDGGPVVWREEVPLVPGENYGLHCQRMGLTAAGVLDGLLEKIEAGDFIQQEPGKPSGYEKKPTPDTLAINWQNHSADDIEWLINACNPVYGGASTWLRGNEVKLLEVTPADVNDAPEIAPGTIVHADAVYGLIVACREKKFLRVNIVSLREGYMSGVKLFALGVKPGDRFYDNRAGINKEESQPEARSL